MRDSLHAIMTACYNVSMKIISVVSQKGGAGKSTLSQALATHADSIDKNVLVIDLDPQSTSAYWYERRLVRGKETPVVVASQVIQLTKLIRDAKENGADLVIIDTAPHSNNDTLKAVAASDIVLIPCRASMPDIDAIENSIDIARLQNKKPKVVINSIHPNAPMMFAEISKTISENYDAHVLPIFIPQRSEFVHSATTGQTPVETDPSGKAACEIKALYDLLMGNLVGFDTVREVDINLA